MKHIYLLCTGVLALSLIPSMQAHAQIEIIGDIVKDVIMAIDLGVQKAQTEIIALQETEKEFENTMQETQLGQIIGWVQQQKDLFSEYYQELWQVKNALANFQRVAEMIDRQAQLVAEYQKATALIRQDKHFSADEITHMIAVYSGILSQSATTIDQLALAIRALVMQMDDGDRLQIIDAAGERIDRNSSDLRQYTQENILLSMQRAKDQNDLNAIRIIYGLPEGLQP